MTGQENPARAGPIHLLVSCDEEHKAHALSTRIQGVDARVRGEAAATSEALVQPATRAPNVLLLEYTPQRETTAWLMLSKFAHPATITRVLLFCPSYAQSEIVNFIQRGASGCLLASSTPALYAKAVCAVHEGESWYPRAELLRALRSQLPPAEFDSWAALAEDELLTTRERQILALVGNAMSNKEIARQLKISDLTVKTHLHHIYVKLHQSGRYKAFVSSPVVSASIRVSTRGNGKQHDVRD